MLLTLCKTNGESFVQEVSIHRSKTAVVVIKEVSVT